MESVEIETTSVDKHFEYFGSEGEWRKGKGNALFLKDGRG